MKLLKKFLLICIGIVVFITALSICKFAVTGTSLLNDIQLKFYELQLKTQKLPENTEFVEIKSVLGKLNGNGNGIDFLNTMLICSDLTFDELNSYYTDMGLDVIQQTSSKFSHKILEHNAEIEYEALKDMVSSENYYVVFQYKSGNALNNFDVRGH